ncbi:glycosyl transferase [Serinicoccus chungangensis]|uniref:D-inositol 3-phosphate glycosyltransferase n=1 Tax=Serinicoccus chungangensis TaxID=767452 RepID=A0A0W8IHE0_9MICO|nr:glycosyltransferase [Serinicoccus chungangensis]KUG59422.1 glycosyl transferase [Serinicoccus chungangensis]
MRVHPSAHPHPPPGRRRVLLLTDSYRPTVNGVVSSVDELRQGLLEAGHEVRVLTVGPTRRTTFDGQVYRLPSLDASHVYPHARLGRPVDGPLLADLVRWRPEVLHSHTEFVAFWWARRLAHRVAVPHVHTYHTLYADYTHYFCPHERLGRSLCAAFARHTLDRTDLVIAPTEKIRRLLQGYAVRPPVEVVPTGVDLARFAPGAGSPELRSALGLEPGVPVVLSLGRLAAEKNLAEVVDLLARVPDPWQLVVAGDGPEAGALHRQVGRLGLGDRVRFVGAVEPSRVPELYRLADVFVSASRTETQGLTVLEALATGVPVVCRDDAAVDGVVVAGRNGERYTTPEEFTRAMTRLLRDPDLRRRWGREAVRTATGLGRDGFVAAVCSAYDRAAGRDSTTVAA